VIEWYTWAAAAVSLAAAVLALVLTLARRPVNDITLGAVVLVELLLVAQVVIAIVSPFAGNGPTGDPLEFWLYLVCALLLPPAAGFWALIDRGRWSNLILCVLFLAVAVMIYRMHQIWTVQTTSTGDGAQALGAAVSLVIARLG